MCLVPDMAESNSLPPISGPLCSLEWRQAPQAEGERPTMGPRSPPASQASAVLPGQLAEHAPTLSCQGPREGQLVRAIGGALKIHRKL